MPRSTILLSALLVVLFVALRIAVAYFQPISGA